MELLQSYFPELSSKQMTQFQQMRDLYLHWNKKVNLISRKDIEHLVLHHLLHSLSIAKVIEFPKAAKVLDVGTGGGFPGIPLAVLFPQVNFILMDSIGKKINVVKDVIENLDLDNAIAIKSRSNEYKEQKFDYIISRAVSTLQKFHSETKHLLSKTSSFNNSGIYYLKGGDFFDELIPFKNTKVYPIKDIFSEDFFSTKYVVYIKS